MALPEIEVSSFTFEPPPPPGKATLTVDTTPVKGEVYLDGVYQGVAPIAVELDPGTYTISFGEVEGYITPEDLTVTLAEGDVVSITSEYMPVAPPVPSWVWWAVGGGAALIIIGLVARK